MKGIIRFFVIVIVLILIGFVIYYYIYNSNSGKSAYNINCNVGNILSMNTPDVVAGAGSIIGIESHKFVNGETKELCCSEIDNELNKYYKVCSFDENNIITYDVWWEKKNGNYIKIKETFPEGENICIFCRKITTDF